MLDSTGYLAIVMISLIHSFSMDSLGSLEQWLNCIEDDLNFITVTKHIFHIRECKKICTEMDNYMRIFHQIVDDMISEDPDAVPIEITPGMIRRKALLSNALDSETDQPTEAVPDFIDSKIFELSPSTIEVYLGKVGIRCLSYLIDGNPLYEVKGTSFWCSQLDSYFAKLDKLTDLYSQKLDEKRNFWTFILTIVSILQFPLSSFPAYWGLNTEGLDELDENWWPEVPGNFKLIFRLNI
jgi:Mg2+ and Co2+ transporter CorA